MICHQSVVRFPQVKPSHSKSPHLYMRTNYHL